MASPTKDIIKQVERIVNMIDHQLLYARVDGINVNGIFTLMELELIEPALFFKMDSKSTQKFVNAVLNRLKH